MKDKKSIVFLVIAIIILIIAIIFVIWSQKIINNLNLELNTNQEINEDINQNGEVSQTKDLDATYIDFLIYDKDGEKVKLSDYKDQAIMVLFWNSESEDSIEMLKRVNEIYPNYKETVKVFAINTNNETKLELLNEIEVPVYYDRTGEVVKQYNITEFPAMLYINSQNEVFNSKTGLTTKDALEANFDILAENY